MLLKSSLKSILNGNSLSRFKFNADIQEPEVRKYGAKLDNTIKCFHNAEADHEEHKQDNSPYFGIFIAMIFIKRYHLKQYFN